MKSDNQEVKEETFIKTSSGSRDGQLGWRGHAARWWLEDWAVPHLCARKLGGTTGEQVRPRDPGCKHRKRITQNL